MNRFPPEFNLAEYHGFVTAGKSQASLVHTYGSVALVLNVRDQDFNQVRRLDLIRHQHACFISGFVSATNCLLSSFINEQGFNPMIYFSFSDTSSHTDIYEVTQGGLLIARTDHLKPKQKHIVEVRYAEILRSLQMKCWLPFPLLV